MSFSDPTRKGARTCQSIKFKAWDRIGVMIIQDDSGVFSVPGINSSLEYHIEQLILKLGWK